MVDRNRLNDILQDVLHRPLVWFIGVPGTFIGAVLLGYGDGWILFTIIAAWAGLGVLTRMIWPSLNVLDPEGLGSFGPGDRRERIERKRSARFETQRNLSAGLLAFSVLLHVSFYFSYHGLVAYCWEYGTVP